MRENLNASVIFESNLNIKIVAVANILMSTDRSPCSEFFKIFGVRTVRCSNCSLEVNCSVLLGVRTVHSKWAARSVRCSESELRTVRSKWTVGSCSVIGMFAQTELFCMFGGPCPRLTRTETKYFQRFSNRFGVQMFSKNSRIIFILEQAVRWSLRPEIAGRRLSSSTTVA